jgi:hypothetical protein
MKNIYLGLKSKILRSEKSDNPKSEIQNLKSRGVGR